MWTSLHHLFFSWIIFESFAGLNSYALPLQRKYGCIKPGYLVYGHVSMEHDSLNQWSWVDPILRRHSFARNPDDMGIYVSEKICM